MTASFTLSKKKKIRDFLRSFPIFNTKHHVIDRQGTRNVPFHETNSIASVSRVRTSSSLLLECPSLPHYWVLDRPKVKLALSFSQLWMNTRLRQLIFQTCEGRSRNHESPPETRGLMFAKECKAFRATPGTSKSHAYFIRM